MMITLKKKTAMQLKLGGLAVNEEMSASTPGSEQQAEQDAIDSDFSPQNSAPVEGNQSLKEVVKPEMADDLPGKVMLEDDDEGEAVGNELTEDAIAHEFVGRHLDDLRYDHDDRSWYIWRNGCWRRDTRRLVFDMIRKFTRDLRDGRKSMSTRAAVEGVEAMASRDRRIAVNSGEWDHDPLLLGTPDVYVRLDTGEQVEVASHLLVTKMTAVTPASKATPFPVFASFLADATGGDQGLVRFLQQYAGYCLTGLTNAQVLLFIYGLGGNGKTVLQNAFMDILNDYAVMAVREAFASSRQSPHLSVLMMLKGARLICLSETEQGQSWDQERINQFTGGDWVTANRMRQDPTSFKPVGKLMIVGNHKPHLRNVNDAARRRILIVPFKHKPAQPDRDLPAKLRAEYPAILAWMIEGCIDWFKNGFSLPDVVKNATDDYFETEDVFGRWIAEKCNCGPSLKSAATQLYESWKEYAVASGEAPKSAKSFSEMLVQRGFQKQKSGSTKYLGIAVKSVTTLKFGDEP